jgi:hypothetical protein
MIINVDVVFQIHLIIVSLFDVCCIRESGSTFEWICPGLCLILKLYSRSAIIQRASLPGEFGLLISQVNAE